MTNQCDPRENIYAILPLNNSDLAVHDRKTTISKFSQDSPIPRIDELIIISDEQVSSHTDNKDVTKTVKYINGKFISSINFNWFTRACQTGNGKIANVAVCCWSQHGFRSKKIDKTFHISTLLGKTFGFNNRQQNAALKELAAAGLVRLEERSGKHYLIEVIIDGS